MHQFLSDALTSMLRVNRQILQFRLVGHTPCRRKTHYLPRCIFGNQQHPARSSSQPHVVRFLPLRSLRIFLLEGHDGGDILRCSRSNYESVSCHLSLVFSHFLFVLGPLLPSLSSLLLRPCQT